MSVASTLWPFCFLALTLREIHPAKRREGRRNNGGGVPDPTPSASDCDDSLTPREAIPRAITSLHTLYFLGPSHMFPGIIQVRRRGPANVSTRIAPRKRRRQNEHFFHNATFCVRAGRDECDMRLNDHPCWPLIVGPMGPPPGRDPYRPNLQPPPYSYSPLPPPVSTGHSRLPSCRFLCRAGRAPCFCTP